MTKRSPVCFCNPVDFPVDTLAVLGIDILDVMCGGDSDKRDREREMLLT